MSKTSKKLKIVYIDPEHKNQFEVTDNKPESRKSPVDGRDCIAVAPSSYDRTAINHEITQEDLDKYSKLKDLCMVGDIVDERELNEFLDVNVGGEEIPIIDDKDDKTDEELKQGK